MSGGYDKGQKGVVRPRDGTLAPGWSPGHEGRAPRGGVPFGRGGMAPVGTHERATERDGWRPPALPTKEKHYVEVISSTDRTGQVTPLRIVWEDGRTFDITDILACERSYERSARRVVVRYTIRVRDRGTYLFFENPAWYVEAKVPPPRVR